MRRSIAIITAATALAFAAGASASGAAGHGGRAGGAYARGMDADVDPGRGPAGRSGFRRDDHARFATPPGGWGFAHGYPSRRHGWRRDIGGFLWPYGGYDSYDGYEGDGGPGGYGGPGFGPQPPMGDSFAAAYPHARPSRPLAPYLAPSAYGPGPRDGAYAYGYNGYAETPALPADVVEAIGPAVCTRC